MSGATVAERLVAAFHGRGTRRVYGMPGGGSSLDLIAAAEALDMSFVLARTENAAVMMAAADAEVTGAPGLALTTKGPGLAQAMNGLAHAALDRAPIALVTDGFTPAQTAYITHQVFDQQAMSAPVVKGHSRLDDDDAADAIERLLDRMATPPRGPVHIELTGPAARREVRAPATRLKVTDQPSADVDAARRLLAEARRPVIVAGLEVRDGAAAEALRSLVAALGCPVLTTYKAKGVVAEDDPCRVGLFTGGSAEAPTVEQADLVVLVGLDPVELILQPWRYAAPVLDLALARHEPHYVEPAVGVYGPLAPTLAALATRNHPTAWQPDEIGALRSAMRLAVGFPPSGAIDPQRIVELAAWVFGDEARMTVDAGAHMFSATAFWPAERPGDLLISNGLASMAFALPAAIAASLAEPARPVVAFTGDGGLMMCIGELATAAQYGSPVTVVVFNDGALSLIDLKQQQRGLAPTGVRWPRADFATVAEGFGCAAWRVDNATDYEAALRAAKAVGGPALIDVVVDPAGYAAQLQAMRG